MIKADVPAKVKHARRAPAVELLCSALAAISVLSAPFARADVSEKEVQGVEQQEFGIENGKTERKTQQPPANPDRPPEDYQPAAEAEKVKSIEAEEFRVKLIKKSRSGRVLLFEDVNDNRPHPGRILLLKKDNDDIAAVRVLKNLPGKFAARIALPINDLKADTEYRAIKKLGDKIVAQIKEREKRGKDLETAKTDEDLAKEVNPDDNELDRGIPTPKKKTKSVMDKPGGATGPEDLDSSGNGASTDKRPEALFTKDGQELPDAESIEVKDDDEITDLTVQEDLPLEPHRWALSLEYAQINSVSAGGGSAAYSALGARLAYNIFRMAFLQKKTLQDMFTLEASLFYYTIASYMVTGDSVTVYPIMGNLRYSLLFGESFMAYLYFGLSENMVSITQASSSSGSPGGTTVAGPLSNTSGSVGIGAMLKIGPQWAIRLDVGKDLFGVGAVLKF